MHSSFKVLVPIYVQSSLFIHIVFYLNHKVTNDDNKLQNNINNIQKYLITVKL